MENEQTTAFAKALDNFAKHFKVNPTFFLTCNEDALIDAINKSFPNSSHLLCIWQNKYTRTTVGVGLKTRDLRGGASV